MPIPAAIASLGFSPTCSTPSMEIVPWSGCSTPNSTFIRVVLPAPFSPSRQWISPGVMSRSMESLATRSPNLLVIPRSRRPASATGAELGVTSQSCRRLRLRLDRDLAAGDVSLERVQLRLQFRRNLGIEVVEGRQPGAIVLQGAHIGLVGERPILSGLDRVRHGHIHALIDAGDDIGAVGLRTHAAVGVNPDGIDLAAAGLGRLQGALASWPRDRKDDVSTLADQAFRRTLTALDVVEVARELPVLLGCIPAQNLHIGALLLVVVVHALTEAIHEDRDCRDLGTTECA